MRSRVLASAFALAALASSMPAGAVDPPQAAAGLGVYTTGPSVVCTSTAVTLVIVDDGLGPLLRLAYGGTGVPQDRCAGTAVYPLVGNPVDGWTLDVYGCASGHVGPATLSSSLLIRDECDGYTLSADVSFA